MSEQNPPIAPRQSPISDPDAPVAPRQERRERPVTQIDLSGLEMASETPEFLTPHQQASGGEGESEGEVRRPLRRGLLERFRRAEEPAGPSSSANPLGGAYPPPPAEPLAMRQRKKGKAPIVAQPAPPPPPPVPQISDLLALIVAFHRVKRVPTTVQSHTDLFPQSWSLGNTTIVYDDGPRGAYLRGVLPNVVPYGPNGEEQDWVVGSGEGQTERMTAFWPSAVRIISGILSFRSNRQVSEEQVLILAQKSPEALEKLKETGKAWKAHVNRLLDPIALRRDPRFNEVSARYKAELRTLIAAQQEAVLAMRRATRLVNDCLARRDAELSRLDSAYTAKKLSAREALAQYGIDLGDDGAEVEAERIAEPPDIDLDF